MELTLAKRKAWIHEELQRAGAAALKNSGPIRCDEKSAELVAKAYADLFEPALIVTDLEFDKATGVVHFTLSMTAIQFILPKANK